MWRWLSASSPHLTSVDLFLLLFDHDVFAVVFSVRIQGIPSLPERFIEVPLGLPFGLRLLFRLPALAVVPRAPHARLDFFFFFETVGEFSMQNTLKTKRFQGKTEGEKEKENRKKKKI